MSEMNLNRGNAPVTVKIIEEPTASRRRMTSVTMTNREAHEEAAGYNLDDSFFRMNGIDPDAEYIEKECGKCSSFIPGAHGRSHWGDCYKAGKTVRDDWKFTERSHKMTVAVVEGEKVCHRCQGCGERKGSEGETKTCETCHGTGRLCEASSLCGCGGKH